MVHLNSIIFFWLQLNSIS